jgi:hypothetical protein
MISGIVYSQVCLHDPNPDEPEPKGLHTDQKTTRKFLNYQRGFLIRVEKIFAFFCTDLTLK